ncbi:MAG: type II toxin-antitoxin system Phd/YefM family antitoxin [Verrucomicrobiae bacterium]|nr:type II toxin-antitoxin system Phd/YefM family antitoxin [Verrucomicrobiae bacterium]
MNATEAANRFGRLLDSARSGAVTIEKQGRPVAVMVSIEDYQRMESALSARPLAGNAAEWDDFVSSMYGCLAGDPLERPEQPGLEQREPVR